MTILTSITTFLYLFVTIRIFYAKYLKISIHQIKNLRMLTFLFIHDFYVFFYMITNLRQKEFHTMRILMVYNINKFC